MCEFPNGNVNGRCEEGTSRNGANGSLAKKQKPQRVPKRGPGVAELEKILGQQKARQMGSSSLFVYPHEGCNTFATLPSGPYSKLTPPSFATNLSPSSSLNREVIFVPKFEHHGMSSRPNPYGGGGNVVYFVGGSTSVPPENAFLPTTSSYVQPRIDTTNSDVATPFGEQFPAPSCPNLPPTYLIQRKPIEHPPYMMFSQSVGPNAPIEPPSNQISCSQNLRSSWPAQEKMIGAKRPWPSATENTSDPYYLHNVQTKFPRQASRPNQSPSYNHCSVQDHVKTIPREANLNYAGQVEVNSNMSMADNRAPNYDFLSLSAARVRSSPAGKNVGQEELKSRLLPLFHGETEEREGSLRSSEVVHEGHLHNFLQDKELVEIEGSSDSCEESEGKLIDLSLKL